MLYERVGLTTVLKDTSKVIVVIEDEPRWQEIIQLWLSLIPEASGLAVQSFSDNPDAERYVRRNAQSIAAYVQDLNRAPNHGYSGGIEGIAFFNDVIAQLTPSAKTLIHSATVDTEVIRNFTNRAPGRMSFLNKIESGLEEFREHVQWLLMPTTSEESAGQSIDQTTVDLINLIGIPWEQVRREITNRPILLDSLDPRMFEELVAEIFRDHGWEVDLTARTRDGGFDIVAIRRSLPTNLKVLVEAKRYSPDRTVGVDVVRSLYGIRTLRAASQVVLATSTTVSADAKKEFSRVIPWELDFLERDKILQWCRQSGSVRIDGSFQSIEAYNPGAAPDANRAKRSRRR
jgi:hypothetical protein